jgi:hypothetical protein
MPASFLLADAQNLSSAGSDYFTRLLPAPPDIYAPFL